MRNMKEYTNDDAFKLLSSVAQVFDEIVRPSTKEDGTKESDATKDSTECKETDTTDCKDTDDTNNKSDTLM